MSPRHKRYRAPSGRDSAERYRAQALARVCVYVHLSCVVRLAHFIRPLSCSFPGGKVGSGKGGKTKQKIHYLHGPFGTIVSYSAAVCSHFNLIFNET